MFGRMGKEGNIAAVPLAKMYTIVMVIICNTHYSYHITTIFCYDAS